MEDISWGDVPGWLGAVGALAVGVAAIVISIAQLRIAGKQNEIAGHQARMAQFLPSIRGYRDAARRVVVRVINEGGGAGEVQMINLIARDHPTRMQKLEWELPTGFPAASTPVPFLIGGLQTAQLVLIPRADLDLDSVCVRVDYGHGDDSGLVDLTVVPGRYHGTTYIPEQR
jgi:hypothetical protein